MQTSCDHSAKIICRDCLAQLILEKEEEIIRLKTNLSFLQEVVYAQLEAKEIAAKSQSAA